jgi:SAM-dependent methyltransferase
MNISSPEPRPIELWANRLDYSLRRYYVDLFHAQKILEINKGSRVLDLGGNKLKKRGQFDIEQYGLRVTYVNLTTAKRPDVQSDAAFLPFVDNSFDVVICSELLEHVQDPSLILSEAHRVLGKDGKLLVCVPFLYQIHGDPYDFGRYTDYYWINQLQNTGFDGIQIEKQGLYWSVMVDMLRAWLYELQARKKLRFRILILKFMSWAKSQAIKFDRLPAHQADPFWGSFTTGFGIVAKKD